MSLWQSTLKRQKNVVLALKGLTTFLAHQSVSRLMPVILGRTFRVQLPIVIKFASSMLI